ncbi:MAG: response regulator [candidate division Zixibacteria bacterium]|nr:response regulator [candidate division Zixibacteria bacterium]
MKFRLGKYSFFIKLLFLTTLTGLPPSLLYLNFSSDLTKKAEMVSHSLSRQFVDNIIGEIDNDVEELRKITAGLITSQSFSQALKNKNQAWFAINLKPGRNQYSLYDGIAVTAQGGKRVYSAGELPPKLLRRKQGTTTQKSIITESSYTSNYRIDFTDEIPLLIIDEIIPSKNKNEIAGIITVTKKLDDWYFDRLSRKSGFDMAILPRDSIPRINWATYIALPSFNQNSGYKEFYVRNSGNGKAEYIILLTGKSNPIDSINLRVYAHDEAIVQAAKAGVPVILIPILLLLYIITISYLLYHHFGKPIGEIRHRLYKLILNRNIQPGEVYGNLSDKDIIISNLTALSDSYQKEIRFINEKSQNYQKYREPLLGISSAISFKEIMIGTCDYLESYGLSRYGVLVKYKAEVEENADILFTYGFHNKDNNALAFITGGEWFSSRPQSGPGSSYSVNLPENSEYPYLVILNLGEYHNYQYSLICPSSADHNVLSGYEDSIKLLCSIIMSRVIDFQKINSINSEINKVRAISRLAESFISGDNPEEMMVSFVSGCRQEFNLEFCSIYTVDSTQGILNRKSYIGEYNNELSKEVIGFNDDNIIAIAHNTAHPQNTPQSSIQFELAIPLIKHSKVFAVFYAFSNRHNFDNNDNLEIISSLVENLTTQLGRFQQDAGSSKEFEILGNWINYIEMLKDNATDPVKFEKTISEFVSHLGISEVVLYNIFEDRGDQKLILSIPDKSVLTKAWNSRVVDSLWPHIIEGKRQLMAINRPSKSQSSSSSDIDRCIIIPLKSGEKVESVFIGGIRKDVEINKSILYMAEIFGGLVNYIVQYNLRFNSLNKQINDLNHYNLIKQEIESSPDTVSAYKTFISNLIEATDISDGFWVKLNQDEPGFSIIGWHNNGDTRCMNENEPWLNEIVDGAGIYERFLVDSQEDATEVYNFFTSGGYQYIAALPVPTKGKIKDIIILTKRKPEGLRPSEFRLVNKLIKFLGKKFDCILSGDISDYENKEIVTQALNEDDVQLEKVTALGEMACGVVHDFNNVLASILGHIQLMLMKIKTGSLPRTKDIIKDLELVEKITMDGSRILKRIQDFSRMTTTDDSELVAIDRLIDDALEITRPRWKDVPIANGIEINIDTNLQEGLYSYGNASELREVLTNLIINSVDAMPEGGEIRIENNSDDFYNYIAISDTGSGMDEETLKKVFNPFFTTKGNKGTGLGMSIAHGIISRHGGEISLESDPDKGSKVTISIPRTEETKPEISEDNTEIQNSSSANVLVIDDEEYIREVLMELLENSGHSVESAIDGEEGIEKFKNGNFDVVITDLGMPKKSGWDVAREIKQHSPETKVILATGWGAQYQNEDYNSKGVDLLVSKPFDMHEILEIVGKSNFEEVEHN